MTNATKSSTQQEISMDTVVRRVKRASGSVNFSELKFLLVFGVSEQGPDIKHII